MNKKFAQLAVCFILGIGIQAGAYLYMDRVLFAPLSSGDYVRRKGQNGGSCGKGREKTFC